MTKYLLSLMLVICVFQIARTQSDSAPADCPPARDHENRSYATLSIGGLDWFTTNLAVTTCRDGSPIDPANFRSAKYGVEYQRKAVESCDLCPDGWRPATHRDYKKMVVSQLAPDELMTKMNFVDMSYDFKYLMHEQGKIYPEDMARSLEDYHRTGKPSYGSVGQTALSPDDFTYVRCVCDGAVQNNALIFNAERSNAIELGNIDFYNGPFTVEMWIKAGKDDTNQAIFSAANGTKTDFSGIINAEGKVQFFVNSKDSNDDSGGQKIESRAPITDGKWHHIAAIHGNNFRVFLYIDGKSQGYSSFDVSFHTGSSSTMTLGTDGAKRYFNGSMDEVRLWDIALSQKRIEAKMKTKLTGFEPNLIAYYPFDQGVAGGNNKSILSLSNMAGSKSGTLKDFSLEGTTSNFVDGAWVTPKDKPDAITIVSAKFGRGTRQRDVTGHLQSLVDDKGPAFKAERNTVAPGTDPAPGEIKELQVTYIVNGKQYKTKFRERASVDLLDYARKNTGTTVQPR